MLFLLGSECRSEYLSFFFFFPEHKPYKTSSISLRLEHKEDLKSFKCILEKSEELNAYLEIRVNKVLYSFYTCWGTA